MNRRHYDPFKNHDGGGLSEKLKREEKDPSDEASTAEKAREVPASEPAPSRRSKYPVSPFVTAGFWIRLVAFVIDLIVAKAFASIFASPITAIAGATEGLFASAVSGLFFYLYFVASTYLTNGQTLGKMITGIRVIHPDEPRLSLVTVMVREGFMRLIQTTFLILYLVTAFTERKQNIGDLISDTYVVKEDLYAVEQARGDIFYLAH